MENLLRTALPRHYGISRNVIAVLKETSCKEYFDLSDKTNTMIVNYTKDLHHIGIKSVMTFQC